MVFSFEIHIRWLILRSWTQGTGMSIQHIKQCQAFGMGTWQLPIELDNPSSFIEVIL